MEIQLDAYHPFVKTMRSDNGARLEFDLSPESISEAMKLSGASGMFKVIIRPDRPASSDAVLEKAKKTRRQELNARMEKYCELSGFDFVEFKNQWKERQGIKSIKELPIEQLHNFSDGFAKLLKEINERGEVDNPTSKN